MKLTIIRDPTSFIDKYVLEVDNNDWTRVRLYPFDHELLHECGGEDASIADRLLGLELLARRIEERG